MAEPALKRNQSASNVAEFSVSELSAAIKRALEDGFGYVRVRGEISGYRGPHSSGHAYFSLKDDSGQIRCAMFRRSADQLAFVPKDGQRVQASGKLDVYGPRGDLQLIVERLDVAGQGTWYERFLRLKAQLEAEGLFDAARKRPLPAHPLRVGNLCIVLPHIKAAINTTTQVL